MSKLLFVLRRAGTMREKRGKKCSINSKSDGLEERIVCLRFRTSPVYSGGLTMQLVRVLLLWFLLYV